MISEEVPGPVMASEPEVPLPTTVLALTMVGSADPRVIVFTPVKLKRITSLPGVVLARVIASLKEVTPSVELMVSAVVVTVIWLLTAYAPISEVIRLKPR